MRRGRTLLPKTNHVDPAENGHHGASKLHTTKRRAHHHIRYILLLALKVTALVVLFIVGAILRQDFLSVRNFYGRSGVNERNYFYHMNGVRGVCDRLDQEWQITLHNFLNSPRLFRNCMWALERAQREYKAQTYSCDDSRDQLTFHAFWEGPMTPVAELGIRSILDSQVCFKLYLWTSTLPSKNNLANHFANQKAITVAQLDATHLMERIQTNFPSLREHLEAYALIFRRISYQHVSEPNQRVVALSDLIRVLVLAAHGGIYLDADVLLLRPLQPLAHRDFYYQWSTNGFCNTAVFGLRLQSPNARTLLERALTVRNRTLIELAEVYHPRSLYYLLQEQSEGTSASLPELLPTAYFDPLWSPSDHHYKSAEAYAQKRYGIRSYDSFFNDVVDTKREDFFPGLFAYHWHNHWTSPIINSTVADTFIKYYQSKTTYE